jgi:predicted RNA-binding protein Jag
VEDLNTEDEIAIWTVAWVEELLGLMDLEGEVKGGGDEEVVALEIDIKERAGRFIGRRGSTLSSIRHLLHVAIAGKFGDRRLEITIPDSRSERPSPPPSDRDDRRRSRSGGGGGGGGSERPRLSEEKLQALARRASERALETGQPVTIKVPLNSYDRRVIHMEISQIEGVESQSVDRPDEESDGNRKFLQIVPKSD